MEANLREDIEATWTMGAATHTNGLFGSGLAERGWGMTRRRHAAICPGAGR